MTSGGRSRKETIAVCINKTPGQDSNREAAASVFEGRDLIEVNAEYCLVACDAVSSDSYQWFCLYMEVALQVRHSAAHVWLKIQFREIFVIRGLSNKLDASRHEIRSYRYLWCI